MPDDETPDEQSPGGRMRFQDESTTPREPTLAERKAREQAERRSSEEAARQRAEAERSRKKRKRILIGGGVAVGLVAVIAVGYAIAQADDEVDAQCVDEDTGVVVDDSNCVTPAASSRTYNSGGGFYPIFIGGGGRQYHYNYGGAGSIGQRVSGGTTVVPDTSTKVRTSSGKSISGTSAGSSSVSRGGLGVSGGGSSSGS